MEEMEEMEELWEEGTVRKVRMEKRKFAKSKQTHKKDYLLLCWN
jgi:hypothetical protein